MYKYCWLLFLIFMPQLLSAIENNGLTSNEIDEKLIAVELQRTGNVKDFENLLSEVNQYKLQFNDYQRCFYNYLEQYNKALLYGFSQSLPGFNKLFISCNDLRIKIRIKNMEANILSYMKRYRESIEALDYSLSKVSEVDDKHLLTIVYSAAFIVYGYIEQYPLSLQFSELLMDESDYQSDHCKGKFNRIKIYLKEDEVRVTENEVDQVFDYCLTVKEPIYGYMMKMEWYSHLLKNKEAVTNWNKILSELQTYEEGINGVSYHYLTRHLLLIKSQIYFILGEAETISHVIEELNNQRLEGEIQWQLTNLDDPTQVYVSEILDANKISVADFVVYDARDTGQPGVRISGGIGED